jgi:C4-dicarboxylate transporter, DctQ subunit
LTKTFDRLIAALADISGLFIAFIVLSVCAEVVMRYAFKYPLSWTVEITGYLQLYVAFFSAAFVLKEEGHVSLDIVIKSASPLARKRLRCVANAAGTVATGVIFCFSAATTYEALLAGTPVIKTLEVPKWLVLAPLSLGCLLLSIEFLRRLFTPYSEV